MAQSKNGMNVFDLVYPIGSICLSVSDVNPAALFGGSWERITDRFLLGAGGSYAAGTTGGEASHKLTEDEMPSHSHAAAITHSDGTLTSEGITATLGYSVNGYRYRLNTYPKGGSAAHNNMPPYLTVYMWKRIS